MKYIIIVLALVLGCKNNISSVDDSLSSDRESFKKKISQKLSDDINIKKAEDYLIKLSAEIENFGGAYLSREGDIIVSVKSSNLDLLNKELIEDKVRNRFQEYSKDITITVADYTYIELVEFRDKIHNSIANANVIYMDLSEDKNRIELGVLKKDDVLMKEFLSELGIPQKAVEIVETEVTLPAYFDEVLDVNYVEKFPLINDQMSSTQLSDLIRPTIGGMLMQNKRVYSGSTYVRNCTFGFNAKWNNQNVFITNSHCTENASPTSQLWEEDINLSFHFPHQFDSPTNQGLEVLDPYGTGSNCPNNHKCRKSDAAVIQFQNINTSDIGMTKIAKTTSRGSNWTNGSTTLVTYNYEFRIIDQDKNILLNMPLNKVGVATGWTHGYVSNTCVTDYNFFGSNKDLNCSYYVSGMKASSGDSGAPVFYENTTPSGDVELVGIIYGVRTAEQKAAFSPVFGIENDLGALEASDLPISVSISGISLIDTSGNYTWTASVNNQNGAINYQWQIKWEGSSSYTNLGSNSSQTINVSNETDFILKLIVSDSNDSDDDIHSVSVDFEGCSPTNPCGF